MDLPKFNETFLPILDILSHGEIITGRKLLELVEQKYYSGLPPELLNQITKSGERLIENRIAWGKSYLKNGRNGSLSPARACSNYRKGKVSQQ